MSADLSRESPSELHVHGGQPSGSGLGQRCRLWVFSCVVWWGMGWAIGWILDAVLWQVSFNYLYSPHEFVRRFWSWSLAAATITAAVATTGRHPVAGVVPVLRSASLCFLITCLVAVAWACGAAAFTSSEPTSSAAAQLAPLRRVNFCQGLWLGAAWGFAAGTVGAVVYLHWHRRGFTKRVNIASGPIAYGLHQ